MVVPVPAQILKLPPRLPSRPRHTSPPPSTFRCTLRIPNVSTGRSDLQAFPRSFVAPLFSYSYKPLFPQLLYFHIHPNPRGVGGTSLQSPSELRVSVANPLFSDVCRLSHLSLRSLRRSLPLFSIACSLFCENTRGGGVDSG